MQVLKVHIKDSEEHKKAMKKREIYMQQLDDINEAISKRVLAKLAAEDSKRRMRLQDIKEKTKAKALETNIKKSAENSKKQRKAAIDACRQMEMDVTTAEIVASKKSKVRLASEKWTGTADKKREALESIEASMDEVLADAVYDYDDERAEDALADYAAKVRSSCDY